ncbi:MAG: phospholipase A [Nitrosomonadales bacterium]|nr:phospholipase A [Nitrosomonadales bacterium]
MKNIIRCCALLFLLPLQFSGIANAAGENPDWLSCSDMRDKEPVTIELDCYRQIAQNPAASHKSLMTTRAHGLVKEWQPINALLNVHKQNYVLVYARASQINSAPTSPNPQNQVLVPAPMDDRDLKFQFSMKHDLADFHRYGSLWFGYTQLSFWQFYDAANSRPFRENNYEPEFIYSLLPGGLMPDVRFNPDIFNFGVVHQSNGQSNPRSRSWNRVYIQPGMERTDGKDRRLILLVKLWHRVKEDAATDDNPDITDYLGHGEIELRYGLDGKWEASAIARARSFQLDLAAPWESIRLLTLAVPGEHNTNIHLQYFNGYGESLIDYNHWHTSWGIGMSFPFD